MILRPFTFAEHLRGTPIRWEVLPWVNAIALLLLLSVAGSRLVFVPGTEVALPSAGAGDMLSIGEAAVLTVKGPDLVFFEGRKLGMADVQGALEQFIRVNGPAPVLVRMDRQLSLQQAMDLAASARAAGVTRLLIPEEKQR